jgi:hypothetical protein
MHTGKEKVSRISLAPVLLAFSLAAGNVFLAPAAYALSELHNIPGQAANETPPAQGSAQGQSQSQTTPGVPMADPLVNSQNNQGVDKTPGTQDNSKPTEVIYDISKVPEPVRKMREQIVEPTDDPIGALKDLSGDPDGDEILAIMLDIVSTGFVHVGQGTADDMYVWPYFAEKDLKSLTPPERVELLRIVTAGDLSDMQEFGGYNFYRLGITPQGKWKFFTAGD